MKLARRRVLVGAAALVLALCVSSCRGAPAQSPAPESSGAPEPSSPPAPAATAPTPQPQPQPQPAPQPTPTPTPTLTPQPSAPDQTARLEIEPAKLRVKLGEELQLRLRNVDDHPLQFHHPGGSNGCQAFHWRMYLERADAVYSTEAPPGVSFACTAVMVPPSEIVIEAGEATAPIVLNTRRLFYAHAPAAKAKPGSVGEPQPERLAPGRYTLRVEGAGVTARAALEIVR